MQKALEHITVLDFSHLLQGPFCTQLLADLGARVIKIERPGAGDLFRSLTFNDTWLGGTESPNFLAWNRNKRSLAIDLKDPQGREAILAIAESADVVVQNFRPGVMQRLGYGYDVLRQVNPRIIYCSGSGYGESGPYVDRPGQDLLVQGLTGILTATGRGDGPPVPVGSGFSDQVGAMNMVYGILSALLFRERSGMGQEVKVDLLSAMLAHQGQELLMALNTGKDSQRPNSGIAHPGMAAPFGVYPTSDGWVTIAMSPFKTLIGVLGANDLVVYDEPSILFSKRDEVWEAVARHTRSWPTSGLLDVLLAADIWCAEVKTHTQVANDPQVQHMGTLTSYQHPAAGEVRVVGPAVKFSETTAKIERPAPMLGEHSREILSEFGMSTKRIDELLQNGVVEQWTGHVES